mmetsp:Transcript_59050/g.118539  ORF Transcript_59050/g.118539 Transcript_59050/m.118539 type:complete len:168 (-) Transcript_59050:60-563(-)
MATDLKGNVYSSTVVSSSNNDNQPSSPSPSSHPFASVGDNGQEEHKEGSKGTCRGSGGSREAGKECSWDDGWAPPLHGAVGGGDVGGDSSISRMSYNGCVSPLGQPASMRQPSVLLTSPVGGGRRAVRFGSLPTTGSTVSRGATRTTTAACACSTSASSSRPESSSA